MTTYIGLLRKSKHTFYAVLILFFCVSALAAQEAKLSQQQMLEDFEIFRGAIEEAHPGLYWYSDTVAVNKRFDKISNAIANSSTENGLTQAEFHRYLQEFYAAIRCGHSWMSNPSFRKRYDNGPFQYPFSIFFDGKRAIIQASYDSLSELRTGQEVLKIDGIKIDEIKEKIYPYLPSDGFNTTSKDRKLQNGLLYYYQLNVKLDSSITLTLKDEQQQIIQKSIQGITKETLAQLEKASKDQLGIDEAYKPMHFQVIDEETGLLTINTFSKFWVRKQQNVRFRKYLKDTFRSIKEQNLSRLIIDMRENGGGNDAAGARLTRYLINQPFSYFRKMELATNKFTYTDYSTSKSLNLLSKLFKKSKEQPGTYLWKHHGPLRRQKPKKYAFNGQLMVLTSGSTFSTAADVCAILHANNRAVFAGEEVGGGYYGNNSAISMDITLPNSKIMFWIPLVRYTNEVDYPDFYGHGVIPDHQISLTATDYLNQEDSVLQKALKFFDSQ